MNLYTICKRLLASAGEGGSYTTTAQVPVNSVGLVAKNTILAREGVQQVTDCICDTTVKMNCK